MLATGTKRGGTPDGTFRTYGRSRSRRRRAGRGLAVLLVLLGILVVGAYAVYSVVTEPPERVQRALYPLDYRETIQSAAQTYSVEPTLVAAVIYVESRYDPEAVSSQNAQGLMQITPDTADFIQNNSGITGDFTEPQTNIWMGTWQLSYLEGRYFGDERAMLAAYNSGQGNVDAWLSDPGFDLESDIPFTETHNYVNDVLDIQDTYRELYGEDLNRDS
ncbi:lytic transglycosylase domain-containing protein [Rubrobacter radiotolerans]|uniref:Lytic transglycosylase domain-containing protein n=1 Tax=Rubrobacter radiotolerans TaxID=42256 RepID=A0AB35T3N3_RUBRA|nr:lytic transglycosylase domain-containing protein [Rubrobacter radiotolerans]MDX5894489.1 lytic transglycosylase domain-containing protein [Rubrobacter radiotolerans]SMC06111.1 soluble lytic murein transglycosylase [Rubrobacter radiotolerans DSM 5868]